MMKNERSDFILLASLIISLGLIISTVIGAWSFLHAQNKDQTIVVTGSARKRIRSDLIVWRVGLSIQSEQLAGAYQKLTGELATVKSYLISKGIHEDQIVVSSITTTTLHGKGPDNETSESGPVIGYTLSEQLEIRSTDVDKVTKISREVTELINQGVILNSMPPEYYYTKLSELKIEMLAEATKDARVRAQQIATSAGSNIGAVRAARMGVIQITPPDSNEVSGYGVNDTTSLEKDITAVVNISFGIN